MVSRDPTVAGPTTQQQVRARNSLRTTLLVWFLAISMVPLIGIGVLAYNSTRGVLADEVTTRLMSAAELHNEFIRSRYAGWIDDLDLYSHLTATRVFLRQSIDAQIAGELEPRDFRLSRSEDQLDREHGAYLRALQEVEGYRDILLIASNGDVVFSVTDGVETPANVFADPGATGLSTACRRATETGRATFSDLFRYDLFAESVTGFLVKKVDDASGEVLGLLAFQLSTAQITSVSQISNVVGQTGATYAIGSDLRLRTASPLKSEDAVLGRPLATEQTLAWQRAQWATDDDRSEPAVLFDYSSPWGRPVVGVHSKLEIGGVHMAIISEIETEEAFASSERLRILFLFLFGTVALAVLVFAVKVSRRITSPISQLTSYAVHLGAGDLEQPIRTDSANEIGLLARSFGDMVARLGEAIETNEALYEREKTMGALAETMMGAADVTDLARRVMTFLCRHVDAQIGVFYEFREKGRLRVIAEYAGTGTGTGETAATFEIGEGIVGQVAAEKRRIVIDEVPANYARVVSGSGEALPRSIVVLPILSDGDLKGVVELASLEKFDETQLEFLDDAAGDIGAALAITGSRDRSVTLLAEMRRQAKALRTNQQELHRRNEELAAHAGAAADSEAKLQEQQIELRAAHAELEMHTQAVEDQRRSLEATNTHLREARNELQAKAEQLESASIYKSEFLANMSHELRTPLNSMLILSRILADDPAGNLTSQQVDVARTIESAGHDLLELVNDILDLSKVEAGRMDVNPERCDLAELCEGVRALLKDQAEQKGIELRLVVGEGVATGVTTDPRRVTQIVKNLVGNGIKFTETGSVTVRLDALPDGAESPLARVAGEDVVALSVVDTGIGLDEQQQRVIFEAFQQADGSTSRQYGGTGLGLSISRELAALLGGRIRVESEVGRGSTFTVYLPREPVESGAEKSGAELAANTRRADRTTADDGADGSVDLLTDDRDSLRAEDRCLLVVEDDNACAAIMIRFIRERGIKCLRARDGAEGLLLAEQYTPDGILLDIGLPDVSGISVLIALKENSLVNHIPVHVVSGMNCSREASYLGAVGFLEKPVTNNELNAALERIERVVTRSSGRVLVCGPEQWRAAVHEAIDPRDIEVVEVLTGAQAENFLSTGSCDCMVVDLDLQDASTTELLGRLKENDGIDLPPVLVYGRRPVTREEAAVISEFGDEVVIKIARSPACLLQNVNLYLGRVEEHLRRSHREMLRRCRDRKAILAGRRVLIVDDDMRTVYAMRTLLEASQIDIVVGRSGHEGLRKFDEDPAIDLVIMDIMMPELDGYDTIRRIRARGDRPELPIIALTAETRTETRHKCIRAGADDFLTKPVEVETILNTLRGWLYRPRIDDPGARSWTCDVGDTKWTTERIPVES